ncbi:uncharacterized protein NPIL_148721 [Nephila pilipes]|uniref:Uncharacterized protein n=1 Tax=Nephila pilipes TaxID=299642 RepID=A0A8X6Q188_NEPPI|nr:uncharacterized protein NPIL_148721 [Nephila pilipes]
MRFMTAAWYQKSSRSIVKPYAAAAGLEFLLMDDNAHRLNITDKYVVSTSLSPPDNLRRLEAVLVEEAPLVPYLRQSIITLKLWWGVRNRKLLLGFVIICEHCNGGGYSVEDKVPGEISAVTSIENGTEIETWSDDLYNATSSNASNPQEMHGFGKRIVSKVKGGIKSIKNKIKNFKIGGGGGTKDGGSGTRGGGYHRPHISGRGGSFSGNPNDLWIVLGVIIAIAVITSFIVFYYKAQKALKVADEDLKGTKF